MIPVLITVLNCFFRGLMTISFMFAERSGVNSGIVAQVFSTSVLFSPLLFYLFSNQRLSFKDLLGCSLIVGSIILIGNSRDGPESSLRSIENLIMSLSFGVGVGLTGSLTSLLVHWSQETLKYPALRIYIDGNLLYGVGSFCLYLREEKYTA